MRAWPVSGLMPKTGRRDRLSKTLSIQNKYLNIIVVDLSPNDQTLTFVHFHHVKEGDSRGPGALAP